MSWACARCTFKHCAEKQEWLSCELCGALRSSQPPGAQSGAQSGALSGTELSAEPETESGTEPRVQSGAAKRGWGSLLPPKPRDIKPNKRRKGLDRPPSLMEHLVVLDFEWTASNKKKMEPIAEITQFPSVLVRLSDNGGQIPTQEGQQRITSSNRHSGAFVVDQFDTFVQPTLNPVLTPFSIELTAITQAQVDAAPRIDEALLRYLNWLRSHRLIDSANSRIGHWCVVSWGDVDVMTTLRNELEYKGITFPACFDAWINLKADSMYRKHYRREPRGGLRACVEALQGVTWEGRAHNGLVDSVNTAKIVVHMARTGFRFLRPTRGIGRDGVPFGLRQQQRQKQQQQKQKQQK